MQQPSGPQLVSDFTARFQNLETEFHRAYWDVQVKADAANEARRAELELELRRVKGDGEAFEAVSTALVNEVHDPIVRRQLEILRSSLMGNQMDDARRAEIVRLSSAVETDFSTFRPEVAGKRVNDNEIDKILRTSEEESLRREAWSASKLIGGVVAGRLRDLVRVRNEVALELGYADFYRMGLELQEIPEDWLTARLDELEELTREPFRSWKEALDERLSRRFGVDRVMPWHYADPFFQMLPPDGGVDLDPVLSDLDPVALATRTFDAWEIDLAEVMAASDLYPRELKCQHAFCLDVDRSGRDVRILANVVPGEQWTEILLHESGHAAYDASIDAKLPYLLRRATHIFVTESIALLCGRLVRDPAWLQEIAGIASETVLSFENDLRRAQAAESMQFARWGLVMTHFERELYADPEGDLDERWWELVSRIQLIEPPDDPPPAAWASKIHLATAPVYYQNYLLGEMLASQLTARLRAENGNVLSPESGRFLAEQVFRRGASLKWDALIEEATGTPLSAKHFAEEFVGSVT